MVPAPAASAPSAPPATGLSPKRLYGIAATAEMITWALLIAGMVARYGFGFDALMFPVGLAHGTAFVSYAVVSAVVGLNQRWPFGRLIAAVALAVVPFATLPFDRWLVRRGLLEGPWRTQAGDDPRDASAIDRALRFWLRHPIALVAVLALAVAIVVVVLLQLGPPTQWFA
ncbi:DUF3817 domain-containing protein [Leucobacter sp. wl10]|uniref:DUF3817 domain-containing protein n=1 Tax=Leucobacter sp. wl10 TaxID=2304677 RepID=UPI000E5A5D6C|nr:DUF3817 domain-containing protein [Leucobacter sp. wl10]RGE21067.1 DUF3817 domain-containing protein [Leucobacter sp. wl10]